MTLPLLMLNVQGPMLSFKAILALRVSSTTPVPTYLPSLHALSDRVKLTISLPSSSPKPIRVPAQRSPRKLVYSASSRNSLICSSKSAQLRLIGWARQRSTADNCRCTSVTRCLRFVRCTTRRILREERGRGQAGKWIGRCSRSSRSRCLSQGIVSYQCRPI